MTTANLSVTETVPAHEKKMKRTGTNGESNGTTERLVRTVTLCEASLARCAESEVDDALALWRKDHDPASAGETVKQAIDAGRIDMALRMLGAIVPFALLSRCDSSAWAVAAAESAWTRRHIASQLSLARKPADAWDAIVRWEAGGGGDVQRAMIRFHLVAFVGAVVRMTDQRLAEHTWRMASPTLRAHVVEVALYHADSTLDLAERAECQKAWSDVAEASEAVDARICKRKRKTLPGLQALIRGAVGSIRNLAAWAAHNDTAASKPLPAK